MATTRIILVGLLCLFLQHHICLSEVRIDSVYKSQVGVREVPTGSNWGPDVSKYLKSVNINFPAAWCAAFVHWCLVQAGIPNTVTAWSPSAENSKNLVYKHGKWYKSARKGDVGTIYYPHLRRVGHTFFYHVPMSPTICKTYEGNTNSAGSREGDGVYVKYRSYKSINSISRWE